MKSRMSLKWARAMCRTSARSLRRALASDVLRHHAHHLEHHRRSCECRNSADVERRRDLDDIGSHYVYSFEQPDHGLHFARGEAADFGRAGSGRHRGIDAVDIERDKGRPIADHGSGLVDRFGFAHEVPNLGILGASVMGTSGAHNPTLTAQALAWRTAEHLS